MRSWLVAVALVGVGAVTGAPVAGQGVDAVSGEKLAAYARAHVAIGQVRDSAHARLAEARNKTVEAQDAVRRELKQKIADIVRAHGMTEEEHRRITYVISVDAAARAEFERIVAELEKSSGSAGNAAVVVLRAQLLEQGHRLEVG